MSQFSALDEWISGPLYLFNVPVRKSNFVPVLNELSTTQLKCMEVQLNKFWPQQWMEVSGELHAPVALHRYTLDSRLGASKIRSGRYEEERNLLVLPGIEPRPSRPSLYRLSYSNDPTSVSGSWTVW
jgi:hypothetical protein